MPQRFLSIHGACQTGTAQHVQAFIDAGADVNCKGKGGWRPLSLAADFNPNADVITTLIKAGAEVNARDRRGYTALMWAASMNRNPAVISALLLGSADVNAADVNGRTAILNAAEDNPNPDIIAALLRGRADANAENKDGKTPLMGVAQNTDCERPLDAISMLVKAGGQVDARDRSFGQTALMWAARNFNPDVVKALIEAGADVKIKDKRGLTALYWVRLARNSHAEPLLIEAGADPAERGPSPRPLADCSEMPDFEPASADTRAGERDVAVQSGPIERGSVTMTFGLEITPSGKLCFSINSEGSECQPHETADNSPSTVLFTGFKSADRTRLEQVAKAHGIFIRKGVCHGLSFLVTGYNAGPAKVADAKREGATVLDEAQFLRLVDTGELPAESNNEGQGGAQS